MTVERDPLLKHYAHNRRADERAESYATKYDRQLHKRVSTHFERRAIQKALQATGLRDALCLDVPCGTGRLNPLLAPVARRVISLDYSPSMVRIHAEARPGSACLVGDSFHLPFAEGTFDLVFSARLSHHIGDDALRAAYMREVMRVSRSHTVLTIFDFDSFKNRLRRLRRWLDGKRPKSTFSRAQVAEIAASAGFELRAAFPLSRLASGHVFYVLRRRGE